MPSTSFGLRRRPRSSRVGVQVLSSMLLFSVMECASAGETQIQHSGDYWQVETPIAINPANPLQLLGAAMMTQNGTISQGVFWSLDGGSTWSDIDVLPAGDPDADPVVAISAETGAFWLNYLAHDGKQYAARSLNQGQDWDIFTVADLGSTSCTSQIPPYDALSIQIVADKNDFTIDNTPASDGYGNLYCAWWSVAKGEPECGGSLPDIISRIDFTRSTDGGETWASPITITSPWAHGTDYLGVFGVDIEVGPNGEVYVAWAVYDDYELNGQQRGAASALAFVYSLDQGATFSDPVRAVPNINGVDYPLNLIGWTARVFSTPTIGVDRSDGPYRGRVYLSWLNHDYTDSGGSSSCCEPNPNDVNLRLVYQDPDLTGAVSWSGSETRIKVNQDTTGNAQFHAKLAVDPSTGVIGAVYFDRRESESDDWARIYLSLSQNGGNSWSDSPVSDSAVSIAEPTCCSGEWWGDYIGLAMHGGVAFPCWYDERTEVSRVYVNRVVYHGMVQYANRSDDSQIGDSFTDQPYDAKAIDYDDDGRPDLLISNETGNGVLFRNQLQQDEALRDVPQFIEENDVGFPSGQEPANTRGIALADMDIDGDLDAFLAAEQKGDVRLYQSTGTASPWFAEISATTGIGSTAAVDSLAVDSWTAAWGDVDRDGRPDLFLGRGDTSGGEPSGALPDRLLRNVKGSGTLRFVDISATAQINSAGNRTTVTASFGELGGDKAPELFVGDAGTAGAALYRLASFNSSGLPVYDFVDGGSNPNLPSISPDDYELVSGSTWADMDSDGDLDLVLAKNASSGNNTVILWSDGEGDFTGTPRKIASGFAISSPLAADLDFSGSIDLLLAPAVDDSLLMLLSNFSPSQHASSFEDVTHHVGLDDGDSKISAVVAADFSGADGDLDGDFDLYLGRTAAAPDENPSTNTSSVFYRAGEGTSSGDDAPRNRWLGIKPRWPAGTGVEWSAIGTIVAIDLPAGTSSPALTTAKIVASDGNRAGEALGEVRFGLGLAEGPATVLIQWPDGKIQEEVIDDEDFNQTHTIDAAHHPDVVQESPSTGFNPTATYEVLGIGQAKWVITWYTEYACDPTLDQAVVTRTSGTCTSSKTLTPTTNGVTHSVVAITGGRYKHTMTYQTATCGTCTYDVTVKSKVSTREDTGTATLTMSTCGQFEG